MAHSPGRCFVWAEVVARGSLFYVYFTFLQPMDARRLRSVLRVHLT